MCNNRTVIAGRSMERIAEIDFLPAKSGYPLGRIKTRSDYEISYKINRTHRKNARMV